MAISHVCLRCGFDLARSRALLDPFYRIPIVRCPRCQSVQVRRKHPLLKYQQNPGRAVHLIIQFTWKALVIYAVSFALYYMMRGLIPQWRSLWVVYFDTNFRDPDLIYDFFLNKIAPLISWLCAAVAGGAIVTGLLHHWKPRLAWAIWFCYLMLLVSNIMLYDLTVSAIEYVLSIKQPHFWSTGWISWSEDVQAAALTFVVSLLGAPIGWMLVRAGVNRRQRKFRKRRIKRRRIQQG